MEGKLREGAPRERARHQVLGGKLEKEASWKVVGATPVATRDLNWNEQRRHRHAPPKGGRDP